MTDQANPKLSIDFSAAMAYGGRHKHVADDYRANVTARRAANIAQKSL